MMSKEIHYQFAKCTGYGGPEVIQFERTVLREMNEDEVLIRTKAASLTTADWRIRSLIMPPGFGFLARPICGLFGPRQPILGTDLSGIIEKVGKNRADFKEGDEVILSRGASLGCHSEYVFSRPGEVLILKPKMMSFEEAASLPFGGLAAADFVSKVKNIDSVKSALIYGGSGSVGSAVLQLLKIHKIRVTVAASPENFEFLKSLGADETLDYSQAQNAKNFDLVVDCAGFSNLSTLLKNANPKNGQIALVSASLSQMLLAPFWNLVLHPRIITAIVGTRREVLQNLCQLYENGNLKIPISHNFSFAELPTAHQQIAKRHKQGNIAIQF